MTHKVVQGIKLLRHKRKSHEMISVTGKSIPTTVNTQERTITKQRRETLTKQISKTLTT